MSKPTSLSREILEDLPKLFGESPSGITLSQLHEYYGESYARLSSAVKHLQAIHRVDIIKGPQSTTLVFPKGRAPKNAIPQLTPLQAKLLMVLQDARRTKGAPLHTNYARLAEVIQGSYGATRAAVQKLVQTRFIVILNPSERGRQDQLIIDVHGD